VLEEHVDRG
jgi:hypothetical protein